MGTDDEAHRSITCNTDADFGGSVNEQRILDGQRADPDGVFLWSRLYQPDSLRRRFLRGRRQRERLLGGDLGMSHGLDPSGSKSCRTGRFGNCQGGSIPRGNHSERVRYEAKGRRRREGDSRRQQECQGGPRRVLVCSRLVIFGGDRLEGRPVTGSMAALHRLPRGDAG